MEWVVLLHVARNAEAIGLVVILTLMVTKPF